MKTFAKFGIPMIAILLLVLPLLAACGNDNGEEATPTPTVPPTVQPTVPPTETSPTPSPTEKIKIKLGLLTDKTGPASTALIPVDTAMADVVRYFNDNDLIPGAKLDIEEYNTEYDASKDIPGYELLKEHGAKVMFSPIPSTAITLKTRADEDHMVLFALTADKAMYTPPGWVFSVNIPTSQIVSTLMDWIPDNDPNFPQDGPAKIGLAAWDLPYAHQLADAAEAYAAAHPEKWTWLGDFLSPLGSPAWDAQVEGLKDADYLIPPSTGFALPSFIGAYNDAGYAATLVGTDAQAAYLNDVVTALGWEGIDQMIFALPYTWWNEDAEIANLAKQVVAEYHSESEAQDLIASGGSYRGGFTQHYGTMTLIAGAINSVGVENFDSQALYDYAITFSHDFDGNTWDYSDTDRTTWTHLGIFRADAASQDFIRVSDPMWLPVVMGP